MKNHLFHLAIAVSGLILVLAPRGTAQVFESLHFFQGSDGAAPWGGLIQGSDGDFYGTTTATPATSGSRYTVTKSLNDGLKFYRLRKD